MSIKTETMQSLISETARARMKHDWTGYTVEQMCMALVRELSELGMAENRGDIHGPHGMRAEFLQIAVVSLRAFESLEGMSEVKGAGQ